MNFLQKGKIASTLLQFLEEKEHRIAMIEKQQQQQKKQLSHLYLNVQELWNCCWPLHRKQTHGHHWNLSHKSDHSSHSCEDKNIKKK